MLRQVLHEIFDSSDDHSQNNISQDCTEHRGDADDDDDELRGGAYLLVEETERDEEVQAEVVDGLDVQMDGREEVRLSAAVLELALRDGVVLVDLVGLEHVGAE